MSSTEQKIHPCTQYAFEVVEGKRVVGQAERMACQRHLDDLRRKGEKGFPWVFDEDKANKIYRWFSYCKHVEGPLAGSPIELLPFQKFDLGSIFGWVHKETGQRRYEKAYIQEARKNAKSTIMSGVSLYLMCADGEESPRVYCAAVDREQARIVYRTAKAMAEKSVDIKKRLRIRDYEISHISRGGSLRPLSKETRNKDGLNPSGVVIDEYHAHPTSEIYDLLWSAWGQRSQALMMIITTAGMDAEKSPCFREYEFCKRILLDSSLNDRYFVMIRELDAEDDEHDPKNWIKCNPLICATPEGLAKMKAMHDEVFNAKDPSKIRNFRIKRLNKWVYDSDKSYIGEYMKDWDEHGMSREEFAELTKGQPCLVGMDLAKKIDLTGVGFVFLVPGDEEKIAVCAHGFMPEEGISRHEQTDRIPYRDWSAAGWLDITGGTVTDYTKVRSYIHDRELDEGWKPAEICFDPYNATHLANEMMDDGYTCVEVRQGVRTLSEPTKLFREMVAQGRVIHDGNPLLKWCLMNAKEEQDNNENIKITKKNAMDTQRVDLLTAVLNAMVRLPALRDSFGRDISNEILDEEWGF